MILVKQAKTFFELQKGFKKIPFSQSEGWYLYLFSLGKSIIFLSDGKETPNILCWGVERKVPLTKLKLITIQGECYRNDISERSLKEFYKNIDSLEYCGVEIFSDSYYNISFEIGLKLAGYKRLLGSFSSNLSIEVNLENELKFDRNWSGNIKKGKKSNLVCLEVLEFDDKVLDQIFGIFDDMSKSKNLAFHNRKGLTALIKSLDMRVFMLFDEDGCPLTVSVIHANFPFSTYVYAASSSTLKMRHGSHYLVYYVLNTLVNEGFKLYDFCKIPVSESKRNGIYMFKKGVRGTKIQYNGQWSKYNNIFIELLMFFYRLFVERKPRY